MTMVHASWSMDKLNMAEITTPRLMAAAKEFNVGKDTLVDFLVGKGFSKDELKPTSKLSEEMYRSLVQEFQSDKEEKKKEPEVIKIYAPDIEGPKVLDKIDLSAIDSSTRPKKLIKKKTQEEE